MNIAFLSSLNPTCIQNWSGTLYFIYLELSKNHSISWIGGELYDKVRVYHQINDDKEFYPEEYAKTFGVILSEKFSKESYDIIICRDYFYLAYLVSKIPVIYLGDTTFDLFNSYLNIQSPNIISMLENTELKAITKADRIVYPSYWAKESAVYHYKKDPDLVHVIEFGANLDTIDFGKGSKSPSSEMCNLLFIGTNWIMKGGDKAVSIFKALQKKHIRVKLTIVGCQPDSDFHDESIVIFPYLDKSLEQDKNLIAQLFSESHFLLAPTIFDCFGIVNCEAAAYGVPVLTNNVGGVSQVVIEKQNGHLFSKDASEQNWVDCIDHYIQNPDQYEILSQQARVEYETRLNWDNWRIRVEEVISKLVTKADTYIPTYVINLRERTDRYEHITNEFKGRSEFDLTIIEASYNTDGRKGLWDSICRIISKAKSDREDVIILCEDDHYFTKYYSANLLFSNIHKAYELGADLLSGGIGGFGNAVYRDFRLYQVDWFWCTQFVVVYSSLFEPILSYEFKDGDTADGILSVLSTCSMVIYPFISEQTDFGYSDVTQSNQENSGRIREHFTSANQAFKTVVIQDKERFI